MSRLRELFELVEKKTLLANPRVSTRAQACRSYIVAVRIAPLDECSVVTAPYESDGQIIGTGRRDRPTRMAYERVIRSSTSPPNCFDALSQH